MGLDHPDLVYDKNQYDPDHDPAYSRQKTGGHNWAGGWIDPSVELPGYKEHPTMSLDESMKRYENTRRKAQSDQLYIRALQLAEGSGF